MNKNFARLFPLFFCLCSTPLVAALTIEVPGTANIFGAGQVTPPAPSGLGGGTLPPAVTVQTGEAFSFDVTGTVSPNVLYSPASPYAGADGGTAFAPTGVTSYGGISGIQADTTMFLVGVFLDDSTPADPAPSVLNFSSTNIGTNFDILAPVLNQTFFIGDGRSGSISNTVQYFIAPAGATRLFLGFADGYSNGTLTGQPGFYSDNAGELAVTITATNSSEIDYTEALLKAYKTIGSLRNQLTTASNLLAASDLRNQQLEDLLINANATIETLQKQNLQLSNRLQSISNSILNLTLDFRSTFRNRSFVIPGITAEQQLANLVGVLRGLSPLDKYKIYTTIKKK